MEMQMAAVAAMKAEKMIMMAEALMVLTLQMAMDTLIMMAEVLMNLTQAKE